MQCYADFEADLLRWEIIRRNVCTAVAVHTRGIVHLRLLLIQFYTGF